MAYLLNRTDIYCDEDNVLECPTCYSGNLNINSVDVEMNKKNKDEIDNVTIEFVCVNCGENIKTLKLINNKDTSVTINWLLSHCEYAEVVSKIFNNKSL
jgi:hypothetical protein